MANTSGSWIYSHPSLISNSITKPTNDLKFHTQHGDIVINTATGEVSLPAGMPISEGSRLFWETLAKSYDTTLQRMIEELADKLYQNRWKRALETAFPKLMREEIDRVRIATQYEMLENFAAAQKSRVAK